ncbi:MAG: 50S ribosomal protein L9 [Gammaproteobacteria bacterium]|uniref:Large ribosomal subunit protein bL9 n=1 Tax=OM182 bacterium MED-G24 TaxID=1986255 RepID=A0A2A5WVI9_9GAMM|nr:50S ribosomal protein L9 [Gammaproteobacteria bacterium]PDH40298.1 MAG: 50S ribosomal protein L9 [OM182 bacterium MED-G24]RPG23136.1 MAG: 50S ribosomal protein L9 [Gammaproteobacteria bacterium TMED50]|tara:strand:- start:618 stop:1070 length:453 start_codon:yes stop_codon:yes gene_type:complete
MQVILLEKIANLGDLGDRVAVKSGYGRNYLVPKNKAVPATAQNIAEFEERRAELERISNERLGEAQGRADKINGTQVTITSKAGEEGKLFGSITVRDIAEAAGRRDIRLDKSEILLPDGPLRMLGEYDVDAKLHPEVIATLKVTVIAEQQ